MGVAVKFLTVSYVFVSFFYKRSNMFKIKKITIIILLCLSSNIVNSESNLSQILVSPGQKGTAIFDSLTSIEVITSEDIRAFGTLLLMKF